jgi:hypothetical protein
MDQSLKLKELEKARRHVAKGDETISRQRKSVAELEAGGYDTTVARQLLASSESIQAIAVSEVERLQKELKQEQRTLPSHIARQSPSNVINLTTERLNKAACKLSVTRQSFDEEK